MKLKILSGLLLTSFVLAGCGGTSSQEGDRTIINFIGIQDTYTQQAMNELVNTYNNGQGITDGVYVNTTWSSGEYGQYASILSSRSCKYNVVSVSTGAAQFKPLAASNLFVQLDTPELLTEENKQQLSFDEISKHLLNAFSYQGSELDPTIGKMKAGEGTALRGMPFGTCPQMLFYNSNILKTKAGVNVVSIPENKLAQYNEENHSNIKPHGYAEYKNSPFEGATSSTNRDGKTVYKVFNDCIPMNWDETRLLSYAFQKQYGYEYGFMSEWWFFYGFSVGGDCIGWDASLRNGKGDYTFTICNKDANWMVTEDMEVNGTRYSKGEALHYEDAKFVNGGSAPVEVTNNLYELPSQYDAFLEFNRLGIPYNKDAENGIKGYGVAPDTTTTRSQRFLTGNNCPFLVETYNNVNNYRGKLGDKFDIAMTPQYREYEGGSYVGNFNDIATQSLKVIGETYDDVVYTGDLATDGKGNSIVGEIQGAGSAMSLCIPSHSDSAKYQKAMKFISWACGKAGQSIMAKGNAFLPVQKSLLFSSEFLNSTDRVAKNTYAASLQSVKQELGDYSYFQTKTWIDPWASTLNSNVRKGQLTLQSFIDQKLNDCNEALAKMTLRVYGR